MRDNSIYRKAATVMALALAVGACGESTGPETLDEAIAYDMAILAGDATLEDMALWSGPDRPPSGLN